MVFLNERLSSDYDFYLSLQILPPVERLCDPIEGTERSRLAEILGLDASRFRTQQAILENEREFHSFESQVSDAERFRLCEPLKIRCRICKEEQPFGGLMDNRNGMLKLSGIHCATTACAALISPASVQLQVENQVRAHINQFYESWVVCDDQSCGNRTRMVGVFGRRCLKPDCRGRMHNEVTLLNMICPRPLILSGGCSFPTRGYTTKCSIISRSLMLRRLGRR